MVRYMLTGVSLIAALALIGCGPSDEAVDTPPETITDPAPLDAPIAEADLPPDDAIPAEEDVPPEAAPPSHDEPVGPTMAAEPSSPVVH